MEPKGGERGRLQARGRSSPGRAREAGQAAGALLPREGKGRLSCREAAMKGQLPQERVELVKVERSW